MSLVQVIQPRCPFCHEQVRPGERQIACTGCRAWHHAACWQEGAWRCSACLGLASATHTVRLSHSPEHEEAVKRQLAVIHSLGAFVLLASIYIFLRLWILPPFRALFLDAGICLTEISQLALSEDLNGVLLLGCLFLLYCGTLRGGRWRDRLAVSALTVSALYTALVLFALFLPIQDCMQRL